MNDFLAGVVAVIVMVGIFLGVVLIQASFFWAIINFILYAFNSTLSLSFIQAIGVTFIVNIFKSIFGSNSEVKVEVPAKYRV